MDKVELTVSIEQEIMNAISIYLNKNGRGSVQKELEKRVAELYDEAVPEQVREYIGLRFQQASVKPHNKRPAQKAAAAARPAAAPDKSPKAEANAKENQNEHEHEHEQK